MKYNYDYVKKSMLERTKTSGEKDYFSHQPLAIREIKNGILLPGKFNIGGGIFDENQYYDQSYLQNAYNLAKAYPFDESELIHDDSEVLYLGMFHDTWGHCLTDCIAQLWPLFSANTPAHIRNAKWIYTTQRPAPLPNNFFKLLELLGIDTSRLVYITKPTKFQKIYLPDKSFYIDTNKNHRVYSAEYEDIINRITSKIDADKSHQKIYLTRTAFSKSPTKKRDFGEEFIEKVFRNLGYHIVSPEKLSFEEQVSIFKGCQVLATTEGSCSHNAMFMNPGSELIIIRKANYSNGYQHPINFMRKLNVTYIDAHLSNLPYERKAPWNGPFFMYVNKHLAAFAGIRPHFPVKTYCQYAYPQLKRKAKSLINRILRMNKK